MTKAALEGLVRQAALELGPRNVNVSPLADLVQGQTLVVDAGTAITLG